MVKHFVVSVTLDLSISNRCARQKSSTPIRTAWEKWNLFYLSHLISTEFFFFFLIKKKEVDSSPCHFFPLWDAALFLFQFVLKHMEFQGFPGDSKIKYLPQTWAKSIQGILAVHQTNCYWTELRWFIFGQLQFWKQWKLLKTVITKILFLSFSKPNFVRKVSVSSSSAISI